MWKRWSCLVFLAVASVIAGRPVSGQTLYSVSREDDQLRTLNLGVNPAVFSGSKTIVTSPPLLVVGCRGLALQPGTNRLWTLIDDGTTTLPRLAYLEPLLGTATTVPATIVGTLNGWFWGLAFDCGGELYGVTTAPDSRAEREAPRPGVAAASKALYRGLIAAASTSTEPTLVALLPTSDYGDAIAHDGARVYHLGGTGVKVFESFAGSPAIITDIPLSGAPMGGASALTTWRSQYALLASGMNELFRLSLNGVTTSIPLTGGPYINGLAFLNQPCGLSGVDDDGSVGNTLAFAAARNPFSQETTLRFTLDRPGAVKLRIVDVAGRAVRTLVSAPLPAGEQSQRWDGRDAAGHEIPAGVYVATLEAGGRRASCRVVRIP